MQRLATESCQGRTLPGRGAGGELSPPTVQGIAHQRMAGMRKVDAYLVRTTGLEDHPQQAVVGEAFDQPVVRNGWAPVGAHSSRAAKPAA